MSILLQKPGIMTTVQDLGRTGSRRFGINPGGAMDRTAARLANILVGNADGTAVLEIHFPSPQIVFEADAAAAIGGADFAPTLDSQTIENWRPFFAKKDSVLKFSEKVAGNRAYLAVKGGFQLEKWLGSSSANLSAGFDGILGRRCEIGDRIVLAEKATHHLDGQGVRISNSLIPLYSSFPTVRIIRGAEFEYLNAAGKRLFLDHDFSISNNSNRMGYRLTGNTIKLAKAREFISSAVSYGTIQILPAGQLIVLMADHQTAGGYPRIGHVITRDLPLLAQLGGNDKVAFHMVKVKEAEDLALEFERELNFLRIACRFQANP